MIIIPTNSSSAPKGPITLRSYGLNAVPTGVQSGDLILWLGSIYYVYAGAVPTGYTLLLSGGQGSGSKAIIGYKIATSSSETISGQSADGYTALAFPGGNVGSYSQILNFINASGNIPSINPQDNSGNSFILTWILGQGAYQAPSSNWSTILNYTITGDYQNGIYKLKNSAVSSTESPSIGTVSCTTFTIEIKN